jgi:hypothetical protein
MALKRPQRDRPQTAGHVPHGSLVRIDRRVNDIVRPAAALQQSRRASGAAPIDVDGAPRDLTAG